MTDFGPPVDPTANYGGPAAPEPDVAMAPPLMAPQIKRDTPEVDSARAALVADVLKWVKETKKFRQKRFDMMRRDMSFVRPGNQWKNVANTAADDRPYEANLTQQYVRNRVAALYAKNPKVVAKRRKRMDFHVWDGSQQTLQGALQRAMGDPGNPAMGVLPTPPMPTPEDQVLLQDVTAGMNYRRMVERVGDTLEVLYHYYMNEGTPTFKVQAKQLVRRTETAGCGILQLGFQRVMGMSPETQARLADDTEKITYLETLLADAQDEKITEAQKELAELKLGVDALQKEQQIVLREGLVFDFPRATEIIVDRECTQLRGLVGAKRVAREYHYTKRQIEQIFSIDIGTSFTQYEPTKTWGDGADKKSDTNVGCVYGVWDRDTGLVYYVCEGYPDFLKNPECPEVKLERFFPFFYLTFNDLEDPNDIYPPSDVEIVRPMQLEYNRSREGLREHRIASKPGYVTARGFLSDKDKENLQNHTANEVIELDIAPDQVKDIKSLIGARPTIEIQPLVYEVDHIYQDFQRVANVQEADFGGTSGSTATEASIAETSRVSSLQSNIDDLDDFLTEVAREAGQILLMEMSPEQVTKIAGPGAVWPQMSREQLAQEIYLEIEAGSSGRPNKALEIANMERLAPYLIQLPNINPEWLAKQFIMRLDDTLDITDAFKMPQPSIVAQNAITQGQAKQPQPMTGNPASEPTGQAHHGGQGGLSPIGVPTNLPGPKPNFPQTPNMPGGGQ